MYLHKREMNLSVKVMSGNIQAKTKTLRQMDNRCVDIHLSFASNTSCRINVPERNHTFNAIEFPNASRLFCHFDDNKCIRRSQVGNLSL